MTTAVAISDGELVRQVRAGQEGAFREIVERHERLVFGVAYAIVGDRGLAEDVAQEAFVAAWHALDQLADRERVGPWLAGIARNLAKSAVRRQARRANAGAGAAADPGPEAAPSPDDEAVARETQVLLRRSLEAIPEIYREPLVLFYIEDRSTRQVAAALGLSEDVVRQRLARGRKALRAAASGQLEAALLTLRPRGGFVAGVLVAVAAGRSTAATAAGTAAGSAAGTTAGTTAGKVMVAAMSTNKVVVVVAVAGLLAGIVVVGRSLLAKRDQPVAAQAPAPRTPAAATERGAAQPERPAATAPAPAAPGKRHRLDNAARDRLLADIRAARARRRLAAGQAGAPGDPGAAGNGRDDAPDEEAEREVIRAAMQELLPLVTDCYDRAREDVPALQGELTVEFTIDAEPDVGGIITASHVVEADPEIDDKELRECVQETMYALEIEPPGHATHDTVRYPLMFAPE